METKISSGLLGHLGLYAVEQPLWQVWQVFYILSSKDIDDAIS